MIENIKLTDFIQTIEIDQTKTQNYVLGTVDFGEKDTQYSLINTLDIVGVERDIWYKRLSDIVIIGYVIADRWDAESMERRKMLLNRFVVPKRRYRMEYDDGKAVDFIVTESIRYGSSHTENNDAFCKFLITGLYRR